MTNEKMLREKLGESGYKMVFVAAKVGISYQALLNKITNKSEFTAQEILALSDLLHLTAEERDAIFFNTVLA